MKPTVLIISCEHGVNAIPPELDHLFSNNVTLTEYSKAADVGAYSLATALSQSLDSPLITNLVSPLVVDCTRSLHHQRCFSDLTRPLPSAVKRMLLEQYYHPVRQQLLNTIQTLITDYQQVLHLSIHTFHPITDGPPSEAAVDILYDSKRHAEREVARIWRSILLQQTPAYRVRINLPLDDKIHDFHKKMRKSFAESDYLGLILQVNQALLCNKTTQSEITQVLTTSLKELLQIL